MDVRELYTSRLAEREALALAIGRNERRISIARLVAIVLAIAAAVTAFWLAAAALAAAFIALVITHGRLISRRRRIEAAAGFYRSGLRRLEGTWPGSGVTADRRKQDHHAFSGDFDLFGRGSLFELLCTAVTTPGQDRLADFLETPAAARSDIIDRQAAAMELRDAIDLREEVHVVASGVAADIDVERLARWAGAPKIPVVLWERIAAVVLPLMTSSMVLMAVWPVVARTVNATHPEAALRFANVIPIWLVIPVLGLQMLFARRLSPRVSGVIAGVNRSEPALAQLARILALIEVRSFTSERLRRLHASISGAHPASAAVEQLRRRVALLDSMRNQFFAPFGLLLLWTTNVALLIDRWRGTHGDDVLTWIDAVAEIEALSALGSFSFENPDYALPEIVEEGPLFEADALGHPLIPRARRVTNDIAFGGELQLLVVSGSNMSGKSTFLRSVGVAAVLAFAGSVVCASRLRIAPMAIGASIRINDSLQEGSSRFYAEIVRIRQILELAAGARPLLFLLDEILHGTNSHDRRIGAEAIVRRLVASPAAGLVTTHDLALAAIAESLGRRAANIHFQDEIIEGRMVFDYRVHAGVVRRSNALELMRSVGIEV